MPLPRADLLAIERTVLANERTFLAYFRTCAVFLTSGLAILNIEFFAEMREFAAVLLLGSPLLLAVGLWRYLAVRRKVLALSKDPSEAA